MTRGRSCVAPTPTRREGPLGRDDPTAPSTNHGQAGTWLSSGPGALTLLAAAAAPRRLDASCRRGSGAHGDLPRPRLGLHTVHAGPRQYRQEQGAVDRLHRARVAAGSIRSADVAAPDGELQPLPARSHGRAAQPREAVGEEDGKRHVLGEIGAWGRRRQQRPRAPPSKAHRRARLRRRGLGPVAVSASARETRTGARSTNCSTGSVRSHVPNSGRRASPAAEIGRFGGRSRSAGNFGRSGPGRRGRGSRRRTKPQAAGSRLRVAPARLTGGRAGPVRDRGCPRSPGGLRAAEPDRNTAAASSSSGNGVVGGDVGPGTPGAGDREEPPSGARGGHVHGIAIHRHPVVGHIQR